MNVEARASSQGWWRWPMMPIAATLGAFLGSGLAILFMWFAMKLQGGLSEDGWYFQYVMPVISSAIFGYLYAAIACEVAPRGKIIAGTVMVTILGLFTVSGIALAWTLPEYSTGRAAQVTVGMTATMVAAVLTLIEASTKYRAGDST